ncbi:unnamed protein product [Plasmodium vivax]|uniref:(malaria parasite P. vivax) hypothetical protein n=1 Tax=Plasmodium vivax TaxID=5855 RepID=A0A8S4H8W9_PLAVI|nr:unnamed protein product [Plasmodium vivax]
MGGVNRWANGKSAKWDDDQKRKLATRQFYLHMFRREKQTNRESGNLESGNLERGKLERVSRVTPRKRMQKGERITLHNMLICLDELDFYDVLGVSDWLHSLDLPDSLVFISASDWRNLLGSLPLLKRLLPLLTVS